MYTLGRLFCGGEFETQAGMVLHALELFELLAAADALGRDLIDRSEQTRRMLAWPQHHTYASLDKEARELWAWATAPAEEFH